MKRYLMQTANITTDDSLLKDEVTFCLFVSVQQIPMKISNQQCVSQFMSKLA